MPGPLKDPFDRMLIAQAQAESLSIVSNEEIFDHYGIRRILAARSGTDSPRSILIPALSEAYFDLRAAFRYPYYTWKSPGYV